MSPDPFSAYQKPATVTGDPFSAYQKPVTPADLPPMTNEDIKSVGRKALDYAPAVGGIIGGTLASGGGALPAIGAAMLGGAAGSAVKQGALAATGAKDAPQSWSAAAGNVAGDTAEQGAMEAGGRLVSAPLQWLASKVTPTRLYQSALRPGLSKRNLPKIDAEVATGLREGIPTSREGLETASGRIEDINKEIADRIAAKSQQLGPVIKPLDVTKPVNRLKPTFSNQVNPDADLAAINRSKSEFLDKHSVPFTGPLPERVDQSEMFGAFPSGEPVARPKVKIPLTLSEAQAEKQGTYRQLRGKYGELSAASTESQKQLARGLKDEIVKLFPEVSALNARDSALIDLEGQLARFVGRQGNKDIMGIGTPIVAGAAGAAAGAAMPAVAAGILKSALDNPEIKSKLAIALYRAGQSTAGKLAMRAAPNVIPATAHLGSGAFDSNKPINTKQSGFGQLPQYAKGGVIRKPTLLSDLKTGKPTGIMGEAGPEEIKPLTKPDDLSSQLEDLTKSFRRAVRIPSGTFPRSIPDGMTTHVDSSTGDKIVFNPNLIGIHDIKTAVAMKRLTPLLGKTHSPSAMSSTKHIMKQSRKTARRLTKSSL